MEIHPALDGSGRDAGDLFQAAISHFIKPLEKLTGIDLRLVPARGSQVLPPDDCNSVCCFRRARTTCARCLRFHSELRERARNATTPQTAVCAQGLTSCSVAIRVHTNVLRFMECVFGLSGERDLDAFEELLCEELEPGGVNLEELRIGYLSTPVVPSQRVDAIITLLAFVATLIAKEVEKSDQGADPSNLDPLQKATRFIELNFTDKLRLSTVARAAGFSADYFSRLFRQTVGLSFNEYVAQRRIAHAQKLLLKKDKRISEVAFACGFESISHFNRSFKEVTRTSPKLYRNSKRLAPSQ